MEYQSFVLLIYVLLLAEVKSFATTASDFGSEKAVKRRLARPSQDTLSLYIHSLGQAAALRNPGTCPGHSHGF